MRENHGSEIARNQLKLGYERQLPVGMMPAFSTIKTVVR